MSRRSTRLNFKGVTNNANLEDTLINSRSDEEDFQDVDSEEEPEPEFEPKKKRRKVAKSVASTAEDQKAKKVRGRRGILSSLREFPLDVVYQIFGYLNPMDLLNLARTTKEIRGILMTRSNAFVWRESRSQIEGLPDLPRDLSEPQYANLCFDGHCHKCLAHPVQTIIWSARTRLCKKCLSEDFLAWSSVVAVTNIETRFAACIPFYEERRRGRRHWNRTELYSIDVATKLSEKCAEFKKEGKLQQNDPKYVEWEKKKSDEMKEIEAHAELCVKWAANRTTNRKDELEDARRLRRDAIVERLTSLGWGEEIPFHAFELDSHKLVRQPKQLTDRIWKNIEAPLVELLTELKKDRLAAAHIKIIRQRRILAAQAYTKFRETFPSDTVFPPKVDMIRTEPFRVVIEDTSIEPEEKVTEESFAAAILQVPGFSSVWKRCKDKELVEMMKKTRPDSVETDLHLAATFFMCSTKEAISYPRILVSSSATPYSPWSRDPGATPLGATSLEQALSAQAWNEPANIRFHAQASSAVRAVVEACGLDPDVTTSAEMDEINPVLECLNCSNDSSRLVMRWIQTAAHYSCWDKPSWKCLDVNEEAFVEAQENEDFTASNRYGNWQEVYRCNLCDDIHKASFHTLKVHLQTAHNSDTVTLQNLKYHIDTSIGIRHPRSVRLKAPVQVENKEAEDGGPSEVDNSMA